MPQNGHDLERLTQVLRKNRLKEITADKSVLQDKFQILFKTYRFFHAVISMLS